jgi:integrase
MRRGELLGLRWADIAGDAIHVQQTAQRITGKGIVFRQPKTRMSRRSVALSTETLAVLRTQRACQAAERLLAGPAYDDHDLVFATGLGTPLEGRNVLRTWYGVVEAAGCRGFASTTFATRTRP